MKRMKINQLLIVDSVLGLYQQIVIVYYND